MRAFSLMPSTLAEARKGLRRVAIAARRRRRSGEGPELVAEEVERHRDGDRDRLGGEFAHRRRADQHLEHDQVDHQAGDADGEEAGRLQVGQPLPRPEGPVAVPEEVAGHGDAEGADRGDRVVDAEVAGEEGEDAEVDQVAGAADDAELEQLDQLSRLRAAAPRRTARVFWPSLIRLAHPPRAARDFVRGRRAGVLARASARRRAGRRARSCRLP